MKLLLFAAGAALLAPAAASAAQPVPEPAGARDVQTRGEALQRVRTLFARADLNRDGALTQEEVPSLRPTGRAGTRGGAGRAGLFDRLDSNRDTVISRDEWARAEALRTERRAGRGDQRRQRLAMRGAMLSAADTDRDSRVTLREAEGAALQRFDRVDLNRDGQVTRAERQQLRQQRQQR